MSKVTRLMEYTYSDGVSSWEIQERRWFFWWRTVAVFTNKAAAHASFNRRNLA